MHPVARTFRTSGRVVIFVTTSILVASCITPIVLGFPVTSTFAMRRRIDLKHAGRTRLFQYTQVISDVDDTLKSSGGEKFAGMVTLGGIDVQYSRGDFYPGVAEFLLYCSLGADGSDTSTVIPPKLAILTARAEEFKVALELKANSKVAVALAKAGKAAGISDWGIGPVLYGSVAEWIVQNRKGLRKFTNFERLLQQDPTGRLLQYIYVGDTGELDPEAGETLLREYPELVQAVFLHVVSEQPGPLSETEYASTMPPAPRYINGRPMIYFRTYVGAAVQAVRLGFMTMYGLEQVIKAATKKLEQEGVSETNDPNGKWLDLERDLQRAYKLLR